MKKKNLFRMGNKRDCRDKRDKRNFFAFRFLPSALRDDVLYHLFRQPAADTFSSQRKRNSAFCFLLSAFCLLLSAFSLHAQVDTRGTDFWLTFGKNFHNNYDNDSLDLQIRIVSAGEAAKGEIYFTGLRTSISFSLAADQVYTCSLDKTQKQAVYNTSMGKNSRSVHVTSSAPVSVYALNQAKASTDATNVLPVSALGIDYYQISYRTSDVGLPDAYSVIATEDNTEIRHNNSVVATLNRGEVYYRAANTDMTGAHITATKPVAFFAMCNGTDIPVWQIAGDCLFQQLAPVNTWGKTFLVPVCRTRQNKEIVRVVASQDNTTIKQKGGTVSAGSLALKAGQYVEIDVTGAGCYITADKPVGVCSFLTGGGQTNDAKSDPSQAWIPSVEQNTNAALMAPFIPKSVGTRLEEHYAMVITPTATKDVTRVKIGAAAPQPLSGGAWHNNPASDMSFYSMELRDSTASYMFTNPEGIVLMGYAHGPYESYYYMAAASMRSLDIGFFVNDHYYLDLANEKFCSFLEFRAKIECDISMEEGHLKWYIDDIEEQAARDRMTWSKILPTGTYRIRMEVLTLNNTMVKTVEGVIVIKSPMLDTLKDVYLCAGDVSPRIVLTGVDVDADSTVWEVTSGLGMIIGMSMENGTSVVPSFTSKNQSSSSSASVVITATPKDSTGCAGVPRTFSITVYTEFSGIDLGKDTAICRKDNLVLDVTHPLATHYQWQDGSTQPFYTVHNAGTYWVRVDSRCGSTGDTIRVSHRNDLILKYTDTSYCINNLPERKIDIGEYPDVSYQWQDGSALQTYIVEQAGIYNVTVSDICMSVTATIEIRDCELGFTLPNIFTPNGDGINDSFAPEFTPAENLKEYEMYIYDRWGRLVFSTEDIQKPWDGNNKQGHPYSNGVYYCVIYYKSIQDKETQTVHTSITLLR